jgi:uncharacterized protein (DUF2249 family)
MINQAPSLLTVTHAIESATAARRWSTELDARAISPPDNFRAIRDALNLLPSGHAQFIRTTSCPTELLQKFSALGASTATEKLPDGSWRSVLCLIRARPNS